MGCSFLACCATEAACCAGSICCQLMCSLCSKAQIKRSNYAKIGYTFFQIFWMIVAIIISSSEKLLNEYFNEKVQDKYDAIKLPELLGVKAEDHVVFIKNPNQLAIQVITMMSFSLFVFHGIIFLIALARNKPAAILHDGCWLAKFLIVISIFTCSWIFLSSPKFFEVYLIAAKYLGSIFLIYQALLMLNLSYKVNELLVANYEKDQTSCSGYILIGTTIGINLINITGWIAQYVSNFKCEDSQTSIQVISWLTLVGILLMYGLVLLRLRKDASILTSSIAAMYCIYLQWSALASDADASCTDQSKASSNNAAQIAIGMFLTVASLFTASCTSTSGEEIEENGGNESMMDQRNSPDTANEVQLHSMNTGKIGQVNQLDQNSDDEEDQGGETTARNPRSGRATASDPLGSHVFAISKQTIQFHVMMLGSALYYAMLCTNWVSPNLHGFGNAAEKAGDPISKNPLFGAGASVDGAAGSAGIAEAVASDINGGNLNSSTYWLKVSCEFITVAIYLFSLVAPMLFPDRSFD